MARSFAWWWLEQCLRQEYPYLYKTEDKTTRDVAIYNPNDEVHNIVLDLCWTASDASILNWFKAHKTRRQRQLIRAYMLYPYARIIGGYK